MRKKLLVVVAALALVLCMPAVAFAANSAFDKGTAESTSYVDTYTGNAFLMERDALNLTVGRDLHWAGDTLNARAEVERRNRRQRFACWQHVERGFFHYSR